MRVRAAVGKYPKTFAENPPAGRDGWFYFLMRYSFRVKAMHMCHALMLYVKQ